MSSHFLVEALFYDTNRPIAISTACSSYHPRRLFRTIPKVTASDKPPRLRRFLSCPKLSQPSVTRKPLFVTMSRTPLSGDAYKRKEKRTEVWLGCGK